MNNSPAEIIWKILIDEGLAIDPDVNQSADWVVWRNYKPDDERTIFNILVAFDSLGRRTGRVQRGGDSIIHPQVQLQARGKNDKVAFARMSMIEKAFDKLTVPRVVVVDGTDYDVYNLSIRPIFPLGKEVDSKRRFTVAMNMFTTIREAVTA